MGKEKKNLSSLLVLTQFTHFKFFLRQPKLPHRDNSTAKLERSGVLMGPAGETPEPEDKRKKKERGIPGIPGKVRREAEATQKKKAQRSPGNKDNTCPSSSGPSRTVCKMFWSSQVA